MPPSRKPKTSPVKKPRTRYPSKMTRGQKITAAALAAAVTALVARKIYYSRHPETLGNLQPWYKGGLFGLKIKK